MRSALPYIISLAIGGVMSTGSPAGFVLSTAALPLCFAQPNRRRAWYVAVAYYAAAVWPAAAAAHNFFGPDTSAIEAVLIWWGAALLLSWPWVLAWTADRRQILWRAPLALVAAVVPPLGIIGWASPLVAAGFLFPGTGWFGLAATAVMPGAVLTFRRTVAAVAGAAIIASWCLCPGDLVPPAGWEAVNTHFGTIGDGPSFSISEYAAAAAIQTCARASSARVIVFPETVVPRWTAATEVFWRPTITKLASEGKVVLIGAGIPVKRAGMLPPTPAFDFAAEIRVLQGSTGTATANSVVAAERRAGWLVTEAGDTFMNCMIVRGAERGVFVQRMPVPVGMWKPFTTGGVPLNLIGTSVMNVRGQRAAILICYEQLTTWPILTAMLRRPTVIVAAGNASWVQNTPIPTWQTTAVRSWSRLLGVPFVLSLNM